jgi:glycine hydroxymethyltransferase
MPQLKARAWVPSQCEDYIQQLATQCAQASSEQTLDQLDQLIQHNQQIHQRDCFNLNPASNVMNPRAEAMLASGLGTRASLGYPGDKYEMGLQAIEHIEVIAAELAAQVFDASFAEVRVASGAMANLYGFMATCKPGDSIIAPPASIGGHVTHHLDGCAGLYGLKIHESPVSPDGFTVDIDGLRQLALQIKPRLITVGGSLNLFEHPVSDVRAIADEVDAHVLFDAAHQCGVIAGKQWANPLDLGAHLMTMSTYKSLGGPAGGLLVTNDAGIAQKVDAIAFPGMTANFDAAKSAALAVTMLDWKEHGSAYAGAMITCAQQFAEHLASNDIPVFRTQNGFTRSHQFAVQASRFGGGQTASRHIEKAGFLACGIGLPIDTVDDDLNGLRIGTPEIVRWGMTESEMPELAKLLARALTNDSPASIAPEVAELRQQFQTVHFAI